MVELWFPGALVDAPDSAALAVRPAAPKTLVAINADKTIGIVFFDNFFFIVVPPFFSDFASGFDYSYHYKRVF